MLEQILPRVLEMERELEAFKTGDRTMLLYGANGPQTRSYEQGAIRSLTRYPEEQQAPRIVSTPPSPVASTSSSSATRADGPLEARDELAALEVLADACARHGALLAVNDRADVALASGADVLHLGQDDLPVAWARTVVGDEVIIGRSAHSAGRDRGRRGRAGRRLLLRGPLLADPDEAGPPGPGAGPGPHRGGAGHRRGPGSRSAGSTRDRLGEVLAAGAERVVVVRAITEADDPQAAAAALAARLRA